MKSESLLTFAAGLLTVERSDAESTLPEIDEIRLRCAISKAYYAVFHEAFSILVAVGVIKNQRSSHHFVQSVFSGVTEDDRLREIGATLLELKRRRTTADYRIGGPCGTPDEDLGSRPFDKRYGEETLEYSRVIHRQMHELQSSSEFPENISGAIREGYEKAQGRRD